MNKIDKIDEAKQVLRDAEAKYGISGPKSNAIRKALALLESKHEPSQSEISIMVSAWDGDISDEEAKELLMKEKPEPGKFTEEMKHLLYYAPNAVNVAEKCFVEIDRLTAELKDKDTA